MKNQRRSVTNIDEILNQYESKSNKPTSFKSVVLCIFSIVIIFITICYFMIERVKPGECILIENKYTNSTKFYNKPDSWVWKGLGTATHYKYSIIVPQENESWNPPK